MNEASFQGVGRSSREELNYSKYFYPHVDKTHPPVLINKHNIQDPKAAAAFERTAWDIRDRVRPPMKEMSYQAFKEIHRHNLQDVFKWAGKERDYTTGRGSAPFAIPEFIAPSMERLFSELNAENNLKGSSKEDFAERAGYYINEINAVHPFVEGNGCTMRSFWLILHTRQATA